MADAALQVRAQVLRTFPLRLHVVVAGRAAPVRLCMIEIDGRYPSDRGVAAVAAFRRQDVIRRLCRCANAGTEAMTGRALPRRAFENGIRVTLLARQIAVAAGQLKACGQVVELGALLRTETPRHKRE